MNEISTKKDPAVLAMEIRTLQQQAESILTCYIIEIGRRLCEAKAVLEHGQWGPWLTEQVEFSQSTAQNYMRIYERYGSEQISLFGDAKSETIGNLPYTKALKLLAVPESEIDDFMAQNDVENMSTRELEQAIRERDAARTALEQAQGNAENLTEELAAAQDAANQAKAAADKLREELEQLQSRPVEVAVQAPTEEMLEEIRAAEAQRFQQEREELKKKIEAAEAKAQKQADKVKKLKADAEKVAEQTKAELQKDLDSAAKAKADAEALAKEQEARAAELERRLKLADSSAAIFQVYFTSAQEDCNRMLGLIKKAQPDQADKLRAALKSLLQAVGAMLEED